jgi:hypothetical protein
MLTTINAKILAISFVMRRTYADPMAVIIRESG